MAWIRVIEEADAGAELTALYTSLIDPGRGGVDNILKIHSLHLGGLRAHVALYTSAMTGTPGLPKLEREMIALVVSRLNGCHY